MVSFSPALLPVKIYKGEPTLGPNETFFGLIEARISMATDHGDCEAPRAHDGASLQASLICQSMSRKP
jgi:hypothetical protein